jgi:hypothetical protein
MVIFVADQGKTSSREREQSIARQRLVEHCLKYRITAEAEVNLLTNGTQTPVSAVTNINKEIPAKTDRTTEDNLLFDMVTFSRVAWQV